LTESVVVAGPGFRRIFRESCFMIKVGKPPQAVQSGFSGIEDHNTKMAITCYFLSIVP